jgi:crotonobetainyl-CoA:carnitine CoA-transferase CaiB-like acyl-CoA transferase
MLMADMGAEVILVERFPNGDPSRAYPAFFESMARSKRSICLDLKSDTSRREFERLVRKADVVLEGYAPGTAKRLGVDYDSLSKINPTLVYASISGFGQTGPYRDRPAHDLSYQAAAGLLDPALTETDSVPSLPVGDIASAMFTSYAVAAALFARERCGKGTFIDVSIADCLVSWMTPSLGPILNGEKPIDVSSMPAYGLFRTCDGRLLTLSITYEDRFWKKLCELTDMGDIAAVSNQERASDAKALAGRIATRIEQRPLSYWEEVFDRAQIPWSPVASLKEVGEDPHFRVRGVFETIRDADGTTRTFVRQPVQFSAYELSPLRSPPLLGQHNAEILGEDTWLSEKLPS